MTTIPVSPDLTGVVAPAPSDLAGVVLLGAEVSGFGLPRRLVMSGLGEFVA